MNPADIFALMAVVESLLELVQRNSNDLTPDQRETLNDRTAAMVEKAKRLFAASVA